MTRTENDLAEDLFIEIVKAELAKDSRVRALNSADVRAHAWVAMEIASIYFNEAYESSKGNIND